MVGIRRNVVVALSGALLAAASPAQCQPAQWSAFGGAPAGSLAVASHAGDLYVGGVFSTVGTVPAQGVARWDGASWTALGIGVTGYGGSQHQVNCLATFNGDLVVGGRFVQAGGSYVSNIARWDGSAWHAFAFGLSVSGQSPLVKALAVYNGELYAGGIFLDASFIPMNFIARWDGTAWQSLAGGMDGPVEALCVYNGELYAGGSFHLAGGVAAADIARWNGTAWQPLGTGTTGTVQALVVHGGELVAAGNFGTAGGLPAPNISRWNGVAWNPLPMVGNNAITALGVYGGDLYAASTLWALPTGLTPGIARWTGSAWEPVGAGVQASSLGFGNGIKSFALHRGALIVGGTITAAGGLTSPDMARWSPPLPLVSITQPATGSVRVNDAWLMSGHEYFNVASPDLCPGGPGTGPYGGLCANDPAILWQQITLPVGTAPFHFAAPSTETTFGNYALPAGFAIDLLCADVTGGTLGCVSEAIRYQVY